MSRWLQVHALKAHKAEPVFNHPEPERFLALSIASEVIDVLEK